MTDEPMARREKLRRDFLKLGRGELLGTASIAVATIVWMFMLSRPAATALAVVIAPLLVILVQGAVYWLLARSWIKLRPMPPTTATVYRILRVVNPIMVVASGVLAAVVYPRITILTWVLLFLWVFTWIEYVNYFFIRLSYPVRRWWPTVAEFRPSYLAQDLRHPQPGP